ncbi:DUF397 domain-containing protein [Streptomyces sp. TRM76323]|uniref:DUF397 domain-containing protein n=1 Tax=Streptomyces tamarix TaxID=3078565 RepID=A0ABU3QIE0_9ACTN|nr:DUF397 domain-containing protein [Streptomyces tamarix]MDT9682512.1 DUF397 domain-containing protein [Streptomyces tamarix]
MSDTPQWFKSSHGIPHGGECVEAAVCSRTGHVRGPKNPGGGSFAVAPSSWTASLADATAP